MGGLIALLLIFLGYVIVFPILLGLKIAQLSERIQALEAQLRGSDAPEGPQDAPASLQIYRDLDDALTQGDLSEPQPLEDRPPAQFLTEDAEREEPGEEHTPEADGPWSGRADKGTRAPKQPLMGPAWPGMRDHVSSNWMVWVGGLALGLSVVFLFRYAVDQGWLTPLARVVMGLIFGGLMLSAGEWVRARPVKALERAIKTDFIPPILTGTGVFAVFVSLYAAHALYGLLGPTTGFIALGLTAYSGLALSLRHGALVGLIGLVAGYLVPGLVSAPESAALPLFLYLFVLSAGCLAVMHWRKWWAFAYLTIAGAYLWPALYMLMDFGLADQGILSGYALGLAALFALLATDLPVKMPGTALVRFVATVLTRSSGVGVTGAGLLLLWLADASGYNSAAFVMIGLYGALALGLGAWRDQLEGLVPLAALAALAVVLIWPQPWQVSEPEALQELGRASGGTALWRYVIPAEFTAFFRALLGYGALFGLGAFAGLRWGRSPVIWAGVSAALPVLFFAIGYWRIAAFEVDWNWSVTATLLALSMFAAALVVARQPAPRRDLPLGLYTAATTAALSLAATCLLREAWLTVALAAEILALAWIWSRLPLREIRALTHVLTAIVILRLVANPELLNYEGTVFGSFHWVLYAYGLPALSTWLASRLFRSGGDTLAATMLEITAAGFGFLMVALQLRLWTSGGLKDTEWDLFDFSVQILWWIVAGGAPATARTAGQASLDRGGGPMGAWPVDRRRDPWQRPGPVAAGTGTACGQLARGQPSRAGLPSARCVVPLLWRLAWLYLARSLPPYALWHRGSSRVRRHHAGNPARLLGRGDGLRVPDPTGQCRGLCLFRGLDRLRDGASGAWYPVEGALPAAGLHGGAHAVGGQGLPLRHVGSDRALPRRVLPGAWHRADRHRAHLSTLRAG